MVPKRYLCRHLCAEPILSESDLVPIPSFIARAPLLMCHARFQRNPLVSEPIRTARFFPFLFLDWIVLDFYDSRLPVPVPYRRYPLSYYRSAAIDSQPSVTITSN